MSCIHYNKILKEEDRHFVKSESHNNCILCLINEKGPMTYDEIGKYLGLTKVRITQIQRAAELKLQRRIKFFS